MKRWPVVAVLAALAVVLASGGLTLSGGATVAAGGPPGRATGPRPTPEELAAIPTRGCTTVVFTPPAAPVAHEADLCVPADPPSGGAIVVIHGGGGYTGSRSDSRQWARWYAGKGHVVLNVDYTIASADAPVPLYPTAERDVKAGVQYLRRLAEPLGIDPEAIVLHGNSAGARLAAQVFVTAGKPWFDGAGLWPDVPDHANAMIGFYGFYDGTVLIPDDYFGGPLDSDDRAVRRRIRRANSIRQAADATGPALLFHGDVDGIVNVRQTERFGEALADAGARVSTRILVDENHAFDIGPDDPFTAPGARSGSEISRWLDSWYPA